MDYRIVNPIPQRLIPQMRDVCQQLFARQMLDDTAPQTVEQWIACIPQHSFAIETSSGQFLGAVWGDNLAVDVLLGHFVFVPRLLTPREKLAVLNYCLSSMYDSGIRKILWMVFADNPAFINFITKRIGATQEGYLKHQERRNGALIDVVMLATFAENFNVPDQSTTQSVRKSYQM